MEGTQERLMRPNDFYDFRYSYYKALKSEAKDLYDQQKYEEAIQKYTAVIEYNPNDPISYVGRAECYEKINDWKKGFEDAKKSIQLDPTLIPGHHQLVVCALRLHQFFDMECSVEKLEEIDPSNEVLRYQSQQRKELDRHLQNLKEANAAKNDMKALEHIRGCLEICPGLIRYKVQEAECLAGLRRFSEAEALANEIVQQDPGNSDAHYILARCLYETDVQRSVQHFNESFRLNQFCDRDREFYLKGKRFLEKTAAAIGAINQENFTQAHELSREMLYQHQTNKAMRGTLLCIMADASYKLGEIGRCLQECEAVFNLKPNHFKALIIRAECYRDQRNYAESIADFEAALKIYPSAEIVRMLEEVKRLREAGNNVNVSLGIEYDAPANRGAQGGS